MKVKDVEEVLTKMTEPYLIVIPAAYSKSGLSYVTFTNEETAISLREWIKIKKLGPEDRIFPVNRRQIERQIEGRFWRLFINSIAPFIDIYLYEEIGWSFIFFGFYNAISSFTTLILKIPFGALIDRYNLKRICFAFPQAFHGIVFLLMAFIRDPYIIAGMFLMESITGSAHMLSVGPLWYEAIPPEVYPIGAAVRGVIYGCFGMVGSVLGAYLWSSLGPIKSFYIMSSAYIVSALAAYWLIRDFKRETIS